MHHENIIRSEEIFDGRVIRVTVDTVQLENGKEGYREIVHHHGAVCIAAVDAEDNLLFVRQFRVPFGKELLELPAGKLEKGEEPLACALRELEEECGCKAETFELLTVMYPTVGYCSEIIHLYLAQDLMPSQQHLDEDEFLSVEKIPFQTALDMVMRNEIPDGKTQLAILKLHAMRTMK